MKKLETTRDIPEGSIIRVYKKGYGYSRFSIIENRSFYLSGFTATDLYSALIDLDVIDAYYWIPNFASFEFKLTCTGRLIKDPFLLFFQHTDTINYSPERKCLKARVNIPLKYFIFNPKETEKGISTDNVQHYNSAVIELSDREAVIVTDEEFPDNHFIFGHLALNNQTIEIIGQKKSVCSDSNGCVIIEFKGMHDKEREMILDFVYSVYRE